MEYALQKLCSKRVVLHTGQLSSGSGPSCHILENWQLHSVNSILEEFGNKLHKCKIFPAEKKIKKNFEFKIEHKKVNWLEHNGKNILNIQDTLQSLTRHLILGDPLVYIVRNIKFTTEKSSIENLHFHLKITGNFEPEGRHPNALLYNSTLHTSGISGKTGNFEPERKHPNAFLCIIIYQKSNVHLQRTYLTVTLL